MSSYSSQSKAVSVQTTFNKVVKLVNWNASYEKSCNDLFDAISGTGFGNFFKNWFNKPIDAIVSLRAYMINDLRIDRERTSVNKLKIGNTSYNISNYPLHKTTITKRIGYFTYKPQSFLDLAPYSTLQLWVPYIGFIDLPINEIVNIRINVMYAIDFTSGIATVYLEDGRNSHVIASQSGQIGVDIPFGTTNEQEIKRNVINTAISTAISLAVIGGSAGVGTPLVAGKETLTNIAIAKTTSNAVLSVANNLQVSYHRGGSAGSQVAFTSPYKPYLIQTRQKMVDVDNVYAHIYGKPLYRTEVLSTISGFTVVDDIHLENLPTATSDEMDEIETLLKSGVHL